MAMVGMTPLRLTRRKPSRAIRCCGVLCACHLEGAPTVASVSFSKAAGFGVEVWKLHGLQGGYEVFEDRNWENNMFKWIYYIYIYTYICNSIIFTICIYIYIWKIQRTHFFSRHDSTKWKVKPPFQRPVNWIDPPMRAKWMVGACH